MSNYHVKDELTVNEEENVIFLGSRIVDLDPDKSDFLALLKKGTKACKHKATAKRKDLVSSD